MPDKDPLIETPVTPVSLLMVTAVEVASIQLLIPVSRLLSLYVVELAMRSTFLPELDEFGLDRFPVVVVANGRRINIVASEGAFFTCADDTSLSGCQTACRVSRTCLLGGLRLTVPPSLAFFSSALSTRSTRHEGDHA